MRRIMEGECAENQQPSDCPATDRHIDTGSLAQGLALASRRAVLYTRTPSSYLRSTFIHFSHIKHIQH